MASAEIGGGYLGREHEVAEIAELAAVAALFLEVALAHDSSRGRRRLDGDSAVQSLAFQRGCAHAFGVEDRVVRARHRLLSLLVGGAGEEFLRERIGVRVTVYDRPWAAVVVVVGIVRAGIGVVGPVSVVCLSTSAPPPSSSSLPPPCNVSP